MELDYSLIEDVELADHHSGYPDFADAHICRALYDGREMTDEELDILNDDGDYVYQCVIDYHF